MRRTAPLVATLALAFGAAAAEEMSPPLPLETARAVIAASGVNPGKIFAVGRARYVIQAVTIEGGGTAFTLRFVIRPLPIHHLPGHQP